MNLARALVGAAIAALLAAPPASADPAQGTTHPDGLDLLRARAPESTVLWFETSELEPLARLGLEHPLAKRILKEPLVQQGLDEGGVDLLAGIKFAEALTGESPWELAHALFSGGVAVGLVSAEPNSEAFFAMARGLDQERMKDAIEMVVGTLQRLGAARPMTPDECAALDRSVVSAWHLGENGDAAAWTVEGTLLYAHRLEDLASCCRMDRRSQALRSTRARLRGTDLPMSTSPGAKSFGWVDLEALEAAGVLDELREMASNPGVHFVLGPVLTYLSQTSALGFDFSTHNGDLALRALGTRTDIGSGLVSFRRETSLEIPQHSIAPPLLGTLGKAAEAVLYRDFGSLLSHRTELFPPRTQPDLAEALAGLALLVGGVDALDELLPALQPRIRVAVDPVSFGAHATPEIALPGVCIAVTVRDPELNGGRLVGAFQTAITLANVDQAMKGKDGYRLALDAARGVTVSHAALATPPQGETVDLRHNFAPACALVGDVFLLGTHRDLVTKAVIELQKPREPSAPAGSIGDWIPMDQVRLDGPALHELGASQRDLLVMNTVLKEGKTTGRAAQETDILLRLLGSVASLDYETFARVSPGAGLLAQVTIRLKK